MLGHISSGEGTNINKMVSGLWEARAESVTRAKVRRAEPQLIGLG